MDGFDVILAAFTTGVAAGSFLMLWIISNQ